MPGRNEPDRLQATLIRVMRRGLQRLPVFAIIVAAMNVRAPHSMIAGGPDGAVSFIIDRVISLAADQILAACAPAAARMIALEYEEAALGADQQHCAQRCAHACTRSSATPSV